MSSMMIRLPRPFKRGNTFRIPFQIKDSAGLPVDITGWTIESQLRDSGDTTIQNFTATITDAVNGWAEVTATAVQTAGWVLGYHLMDIKTTDANGDVGSTIDIQVLVEEGPTHG